MQEKIIIIGMGELGSVFSTGFLKLGHTLQGITRNQSIQQVAAQTPNPLAVLVAVGEADLQNILKTLPQNWLDKLILIQNELLPNDWLSNSVHNPTVVSVWFEKKSGTPAKVVQPSIVYGPQATLVQNALDTLNLPCRTLEQPSQLAFELVLKNLYILTSNIAGLVVGGTVGQLIDKHAELLNHLADEVIQIQTHLTGKTQDAPLLKQALIKAFQADPNHQCMGRSAPARLNRALAIAKQGKLNLPKLQEIARTIS